MHEDRDHLLEPRAEIRADSGGVAGSFVAASAARQGSVQPAPKPVTGLYAVCDPDGHIDHTTLSTRDEDAIASWMTTEQTLVPVLRGKPAQSWEVYEAEGYRVVRCDLVPPITALTRNEG